MKYIINEERFDFIPPEDKAFIIAFDEEITGLETVGSRFIEKCSGVVFEFWKPDLDKLPDYIALLSEFDTPQRKAQKLRG